MAFMVLLLAALCVCPSIKAQERSCSALLAKNPSTPSGEYNIDPDGPGREDEFTVQCDMSQDGGVTILSHDSENRTHVFSFNKPGSYKRVVTYTANSIQVERLARISTVCKQNLIYECLNSRLSNFAWWVSRDGEPRTYWGDTEGNRGPGTVCQCEVQSSCASSSLPCNCDVNDHLWREDGGDLIFKPDLPVIELRFGDTKNDSVEEGYHILGKLRCYGQQDIDDCEPDPCLNGGSCVDLVNDFQCDCGSGYAGKICETDIDECASNPCTSGQVCTDAVNEYSCTCPTGQTCANAEGQSSEDGCGSYCILIILLSLCIGIGILCIIVIASGIKYTMG